MLQVQGRVQIFLVQEKNWQSPSLPGATLLSSLNAYHIQLGFVLPLDAKVASNYSPAYSLIVEILTEDGS